MLSCDGPSKLPFGRSVFWLVMSVRMSSIAIPNEASARGLTLICTAGRSPPASDTWPTPLSCDSFWAMRTSARSSIWVSDSVFEVTASVITGVSAGLILA